MTSETPFHEQRVLTPHHRHLIHLPVTGRATNTFCDMNAVVEVHEVRKIVNSGPAKRRICAKAGSHRLEHRARSPNLRVTTHACVSRRKPGERGGFNRCVAVPTVDADPGDMMLMAERNRLGADDVHFRQIVGAEDNDQQQGDQADDDYSAKNRDLGDHVRAAMKDLGHEPPLTANATAREMHAASQQADCVCA